MRRIALLAIAAGFVVPLMASAPAQAQATRTWVSGVGDDANPCSRTAPCKTFPGAISKTAAGGEINCLDSAGFGAVTIGKSLTIPCDGVVGGMVVSGSNGVLINAASTDVVTLKGLDIEGLGMTTTGVGLNGIKVLAAAAVHVEDCIIRDFKAATPNGFGILVAPTTTLTFTVTNTIPVGASPHSTALAPDGQTLAVVNYSSSEVSIIDTARDIELKRLPTDENPQDVAWSADGAMVYTANVDGQFGGRPVGTISVINVATGGQSRLITNDPGMDSAPTSIARSKDGATGYVTNLRAGTVTVYDLGR